MKKIRRILRQLLGANEFETIEDALLRKKINVEKKIFKEKFTKNDLEVLLKDMGVKEGMCLMVHASWRQFYNFEGTPDDVIDLLKQLIGKDGTLLMPSYGRDKVFFDVDNTPSAAGVLSEVFRKRNDIYRSACTNFSVAASGKYAKELTAYHIKSEYGFDEHSPYYLLQNYKNSKILFLGLSSKPSKISLFHCAGYILKDEILFYKNIYTTNLVTQLISEGKSYTKNMISRSFFYKNNIKVFKKIFNDIKEKDTKKTSNLVIVLMDYTEGLNLAISYAKNGEYCYKKSVRSLFLK